MPQPGQERSKPGRIPVHIFWQGTVRGCRICEVCQVESPHRLVQLVRSVGSALLFRPVLLATVGVGFALAALRLDETFPTEVAGLWVVDPAGARAVYTALVGALLTLAGLTFWVRAASVNLAATQYSPRVVHEMLEDFFQQSMMAAMLGGFAYTLVVYQGIDLDATVAPPVATTGGLLLAGGAIVAVMGAIRQSVRATSPQALSQRIAQATIDKVRRASRQDADPAALEFPLNIRTVSEPGGDPAVIRAQKPGWVQRIDAAALREAAPDGATIRIDVRVGMFVAEGRPLATVWADSEVDGLAVRRSVVRGRRRVLRDDVEYGLQQLTDIATSALTNAGDTVTAEEMVAQIEAVIRVLATAPIPALAYGDEQGRQVLRVKEFTFADFAEVAYGPLRRAVGPHPAVAISLIRSVARLHGELAGTQDAARLGPLCRHVRLVVAEVAAAGLLAEDVERVQRVAARTGLLEKPEQV